MDWLKGFCFVSLLVFVVSCGNNDSKVKDLELKLDEIVALADSINTEHKLLSEMFKMQESDIFSLRDSVFSLTRNNIFLKAENSRLSLALDNKESVLQKKRKGEKPAVATSNAKFDTTSKKPASIFEPPSMADSVASPAASSFIDFIWKKRNKVEP